VTESARGSGRTGVLLAAAGAICYGFTVVIGEDMADAGFGPSTSLGVRFFIAAAMLAIVLRVRGVRLFPSRAEVLTGLGLGLAYALEARFFFNSLERMTAAASALVFYVYPSIVTVIELARGREQAHRSTFVALGLSTAGTAVVVAAGSEVSVTAAGVAFALAAASTFAVYLVIGRQVGHRTDPMVLGCWVAFGASFVNLGLGVIGGQLVNPSSRALELVLYGLATAFAFTLSFAAMRRISASRVAVVMTLEAASAVVMAAVFLGESLVAAQVVGGIAVLGAAVVIARTQPDDVSTAEATAPGAAP
jgi:drug/metabolite transporter (DMT)-like permease